MTFRSIKAKEWWQMLWRYPLSHKFNCAGMWEAWRERSKQLVKFPDFRPGVACHVWLGRHSRVAVVSLRAIRRWRSKLVKP